MDNNFIMANNVLKCYNLMCGERIKLDNNGGNENIFRKIYKCHYNKSQFSSRSAAVLFLLSLIFVFLT